eukprot:Hpha_TRINITY_DN15119_c6_g5::TRINITY_DN15119_c6_g5_i1::g.126776::m.126776
MFGCRWDWLVRQGDTPEEVRIKTSLFPFALLMVVNAAWLIYYTLTGSNQMLNVVAYSVHGVSFILFIVGILWNVMHARYLADVLLLLSVVGVCLNDLGNATRSSPFRSWAYTVLILDIALVFKRNHMPRFIIALVLVYLVTLQVESVLRFGMYEAGYWGTEGVEISSCNCVSPPCGVTPVDAWLNMLGMIIVFLGDFHLTRGFASGMRLQLRRVEASVAVAGE